MRPSGKVNELRGYFQRFVFNRPALCLSNCCNKLRRFWVVLVMAWVGQYKDVWMGVSILALLFVVKYLMVLIRSVQYTDC